MRKWIIGSSLVVAGVFAVGGCSKSPNTAPRTVSPPAVSSADYQLDVRFTDADSGYTLKRVEYADPTGTVVPVDFKAPVWKHTLTLKPGDRLYLHAVVEYRSCLAGGLQITADPGFYRSSWATSCEGPQTAELVIDEIVK